MSENKDVIPLEDLDKLLAEEDPEFSKGLEEVRAVEADKSIELEAAAIDETLGDEPAVERLSILQRLKRGARTRAQNFYLQTRARIVQGAKDGLVFLRTRPKEFALYSIVVLKGAAKTAVQPIKAFQAASRTQKLLVLVLLGLSGATVAVLLGNLKGIWIPHLNEPILRGFEEHADFVETIQPDDKGESFYAAFPQERHEFLFKKMKVNLKRSESNPNPMGAFEVIVLVDSKDTAIEVADREVELHDLLQRTFEEETFTDLETELGKTRLKGRIKREINQKLTQGWVKDVNFKTFVLKP